MWHSISFNITSKESTESHCDSTKTTCEVLSAPTSLLEAENVPPDTARRLPEVSVGDSGLNHELLPKASQRYGYFGNFSSKEFLLILLSRSLTLSLSLSPSRFNRLHRSNSTWLPTTFPDSR